MCAMPVRQRSRMAGATLVELLISLVVGSVVVAASYASYQVVHSIYENSQDLTEIHQQGREGLWMLRRDLRMAGFVNRNNLTFSALPRTITSPIAVTNDVPLSCGSSSYINDQLTLIYDDLNGATAAGTDLRRKVSYLVGCDSGRLVLQQQVETSSGGAFAVTQSLVSLVSDIGNLQLQFITSSGTVSDSVPSANLERVEIEFDVLGLGYQKGKSDSARLNRHYRAVARTCNLGCG